MADVFDFSCISDAAYSSAQEAIASNLEGQKYNLTKVTDWVESIGSETLSRLREISPNFKYIVNVLVLSKSGAGLHLETCSFWDAKTDGSVTVKFENETMTCIVTCLGLAI